MSELTFNEKQVLFLLRRVEAGASVMQTCRKYGIGKVGQYSMPSRPAMAMRGGLFSRLDHDLNSSTHGHEPPPGAATDAKLPFSCFVRIDRSLMKLHDAPRYVILDNGPEFDSVRVNRGTRSFEIGLRGETSRHFALHRMWDDCTRRCVGLSTTAPARRAPHRHYSDDFKADAVALANSIGRQKAARQLGIPTKTLRNWLYTSSAGGLPSLARNGDWRWQ